MGFAHYQGPKLGRVLLVEGLAPLDASFSEYFRERGIDIYAARGVTDARALLPALKPDVTILALDLGDGDAFDCSRISAKLVRASDLVRSRSTRGPSSRAFPGGRRLRRENGGSRGDLPAHSKHSRELVFANHRGQPVDHRSSRDQG